MALRYAGNNFDAEDMVQETFYTAFKNFHQLRDKGKCKSWLFAILRNIYLKERRQRERIYKIEQSEDVNYLSYLEEAAEQFDIEKAVVNKIDSDRIGHTLDRLPEKYKSPLLLFYMENSTYKEISDTLDIPIGTVMSRLARGKELLKKEIMRGLMLAEASEKKVVDFEKYQRDHTIK
jgi:RNA polymerase sigma-70 factor (ECF subfamily)